MYKVETNVNYKHTNYQMSASDLTLSSSFQWSNCHITWFDSRIIICNTTWLVSLWNEDSESKRFQPCLQPSTRDSFFLHPVEWKWLTRAKRSRIWSQNGPKWIPKS